MKSKLLNIALVLSLILVSCSQKKENEMDLILHNATIYTVDDKFSKAESIAVKDGIIKDIGDSKEILNKYTAKTIIDCEGKYIFPGL
ncbi:MAG: hypothetical protein R6U11_00435, partial [Bacteroidales bacterium]